MLMQIVAPACQAPDHRVKYTAMKRHKGSEKVVRPRRGTHCVVDRSEPDKFNVYLSQVDAFGHASSSETHGNECELQDTIGGGGTPGLGTASWLLRVCLVDPLAEWLACSYQSCLPRTCHLFGLFARSGGLHLLCCHHRTTSIEFG